jgi:hypothetical protein
VKNQRIFLPLKTTFFERLSFAGLILAKCRLHAKPLVFAIQYSAARELKVEREITGFSFISFGKPKLF